MTIDTDRTAFSTERARYTILRRLCFMSHQLVYLVRDNREDTYVAKFDHDEAENYPFFRRERHALQTLRPVAGITIPRIVDIVPQIQSPLNEGNARGLIMPFYAGKTIQECMVQFFWIMH